MHMVAIYDSGTYICNYILCTLKNNCRKLGLSMVDDQLLGGLNDTLVISATENATPNANIYS